MKIRNDGPASEGNTVHRRCRLHSVLRLRMNQPNPPAPVSEVGLPAHMGGRTVSEPGPISKRSGGGKGVPGRGTGQAGAAAGGGSRAHRGLAATSADLVDSSVGQVPMERLRSVFDGMFDGVWLVAADGRTTYANGSMARLLGSTPAAMRGRPMVSFVEESLQAGIREIPEAASESTPASASSSDSGAKTGALWSPSSRAARSRPKTAPTSGRS
jgi:PAS domain-containing protein